MVLTPLFWSRYGADSLVEFEIYRFRRRERHMLAWYLLPPINPKPAFQGYICLFPYSHMI
jgi:hypothetical protein